MLFGTTFVLEVFLQIDIERNIQQNKFVELV